MHKSGRMLVRKDTHCKRWRECFKEVTGKEGDRDVSTGTVEIDVRGEIDIWGKKTLQKRKNNKALKSCQNLKDYFIKRPFYQ